MIDFFRQTKSLHTTVNRTKLYPSDARPNSRKSLAERLSEECGDIVQRLYEKLWRSYIVLEGVRSPCDSRPAPLSDKITTATATAFVVHVSRLLRSLRSRSVRPSSTNYFVLNFGPRLPTVDTNPGMGRNLRYRGGGA